MNSLLPSNARTIGAIFPALLAQTRRFRRFLAITALVLVAATVSSQALTISVEIGRQSKSCTGFGICSVTIGLETSRSVPASAVLSGNMMMMQFLAPPPDRGNTLVVENDVVLDRATSLGLGYQQVTIKKGAYPVTYNGTPNGVVGVNVQTAGIVVTINVGRRSKDCTGFGICSIVIGSSSAMEHPVPGVGTIGNGMLDLDLLETTANHGDSLTIDEDITLDDAASHAFGYQQVTVRKGTYPVDYSSNPNGHVQIPVATIGITIGVEVGRRSKDCTGFGICSITIGFEISANRVPASASVQNGKLVVDLLGSNGLHEDMLPIDEDITLDYKTSLELGYKQVTVRKGLYPVDYSHNPNGHVVLDIATAGLRLDIKIGRASQDCWNFGICAVRLGNAASTERFVGGSVALNGDKIDIDFLGQTPDRGDLLTIDEDIVLDDSTSHALGYQQVMVRKGSYPVDYSSNPFGHVQVSVATIGVTINVKLGRRSKDCTGFGICSVTIGIDISANSVPASATVQNGKLAIDLLGSNGTREDMLPIDEDIVVDKAVALALGYQSLTIKKGLYPVDYTSNPNGHVVVNVETAGISINIKFGRRSQDCWNFGICDIRIGSAFTERSVASSASLHGDQLSLDFLVQTPDRGEVLTIDEDIVLDDATSRALGYQQVTVRKGSYTVDYSSNPYGHVEIPVARIGVTIGIEVGRRSKGCTGFGICSITIGFELSANRVPASASVQNGKLVVDLLGMTSVREDVLPIDEDIVLDAATSQALGYRQVTIKKGNYPVDYKSNPNGHVVLDIATVGITVYVKFGRPSRNCAGFGICEISVGLSLNVAENVLPAVATMENGTLELQMLALPGEHGDTLPVEQDVVLDAATAKALGATQLTVKQGAYRVDYGSNPNGTVVLTTSSGSSAGVANEVALRGGNSLMAKVTPNPVSSAATVSFVLPQSDRVTLTVTNARGEEVARLMDGEFLTAGAHSASFNSALLPAGAYFYTVRAGATAETHPMQIAK